MQFANVVFTFNYSEIYFIYNSYYRELDQYTMALSRISNFTTVKLAQAAHHQGYSRYCASRKMQCSYVSLMSISLILFKPQHFGDLFD